VPRRPRIATGGYVYHALNRAVGRSTIFEKDDDYAAFEAVLEEAREQVDTRLLAFSVMPNHWHLVLWPREDGDLSDYMGWLTNTHTRRWHLAHGTVGTGPLYQGRFKSFPIQEDEHFFTVCRYVERNALRANLVTSAEQWRWSSLWQRVNAAFNSFVPRRCPDQAAVKPARRVLAGCPGGFDPISSWPAVRLGGLPRWPAIERRRGMCHS
jgi:putative transposase